MEVRFKVTCQCAAYDVTCHYAVGLFRMPIQLPTERRRGVNAVYRRATLHAVASVACTGIDRLYFDVYIVDNQGDRYLVLATCSQYAYWHHHAGTDAEAPSETLAHAVDHYFRHHHPDCRVEFIGYAI